VLAQKFVGWTCVVLAQSFVLVIVVVMEAVKMSRLRWFWQVERREKDD